MEDNPFNSSHESLEALVDTISEVLRCPVTIEDANHRLLAYSSHTPHTDPARLATIIGRRVPENIVSSLWRMGIIQQLMQSDEPVRVAAISEVGLGGRVAIAIRKQQEVLGYIWVSEEQRTLNRHDMEQLKLAAAAARTKLLQHQTQHRKQQESRQNLFWQIVTGHLKTDEEIREKAKALGLGLPRSFQILVLQFPAAITDHLYTQIQYVITTSRLMRVALFTVDRNQLILLQEPPSPGWSSLEVQKLLASFQTSMTERFGTSSLIFGCGNEYEDFSRAERSYNEALTVVRIKEQFPEQTENIILYRDLGYYRFLPAMLEHNRQNHYRNPHLQKLKEYDKAHQSSLVETLECFLAMDGNVKLTAEALHIHVNSLMYRLKRISEIGGIDLNNMDQKVTLYLDLKTEKLGK